MYGGGHFGCVVWQLIAHCVLAPSASTTQILCVNGTLHAACQPCRKAQISRHNTNY